MSWDERWGFVRGDRRQIQTAVLGGADSEEPLMLPLEAIELDAFRRRHEHDTFWCGLLLGGCGQVPTWDDPEGVTRVLLEASSPG